MTTRSILPCDDLRRALPNKARVLLDGMLGRQTASGTDAMILYSLLPDEQRASVLLCLAQWKAAPALLRECIRHFWKVDNRVILRGSGFSLERARTLFRRAQFPVPDDTPPIVQVWRGTTGRTLDLASQGLCWTLVRDVACWFAMMHEHRDPGDPLVLTAFVTRDKILFVDQDDGLQEQEVVLEQILTAERDPGDEAEWQERAVRHALKRKQAGF